jgi:diaminopropionate ammonia-lyase
MGAAGFLLNPRKSYEPDLGPDIKFILNKFDEPYSFHKTLEEYFETPLYPLKHLAKTLGVNNILVKDEGSRFGTFALKILGASFAIHKLNKEEKNIRGVCTATDGNHGRAIAWSAKKYGFKSVIFVPNYTTHSRIKYIEEQHAKVVISSGNYDQAVAEASEFAKESGFHLIQDSAWINYIKVPTTITAGYYTQLHEINSQTSKLHTPKIDVIIIQAGVGSWPSSVVHFIREYNHNTNVKIVCVEPFESDAIYESVKRASLASTRKSQKTIMAGLNCGTPSYLAYEILKQGIDAFLIISDEYAIDAIKYLNAPLPGDPYIAAGESGSAGLGGLVAIINNHQLADLKKYLNITPESNILLFNTENVTDPELNKQIMSGRMLGF